MHIDPGVFHESRISEDTARFNRDLEDQLAQLPPIYQFEPQVLRDFTTAGEGILPAMPKHERAYTKKIDGPGGDIELRIVRPDKPSGVYLHFHGGGWMLGSAHEQDPALVMFCDATGLAMVSVHYRLAPEHPYPAGPDDCEAAARWLLDNAKEEFQTDRLLIGGESAGAHLTAVTLLRLRNSFGTTRFQAANLAYGGYDMNKTPSVRNWGDRNLIINTPILDWFADNFVPPGDFPPERRQHPDISPLNADLADMPPTLFTVGTLDPLIDDSLFMAARWSSAGNRADLAVYPGGIHAFNAFPIPLAMQANLRMVAFVREFLG